MTTFSKAVCAASVAAVLGLSMGVSAPAVLAQPAPQVQKGNIDFSKKGSLTLYKKKGAESDTPATGKEMQNVPGEALNGLIVKMSVFWFGIRRCPAVLW